MKNFPLWLIFFLALFLRVYQLGTLPHGFYEEEVTNAYVGRFILENGRDLYGNWFPLLYFDKFGDFPPVIPMYLAGVSTYIFGLTEFAARFPTALIGALTVLPFFGLSFFVFKNKKLSLLSAFFLAVVPWHVVLSRTSAEGIIGLAVYTWALYLFFKKNHKAFFLFFLCYFLYPGLRIIVPLTLLPFYKKYFRHIVFFFLLTAVIAATPWGKGRFIQTSIFHSDEVRERVAFKNRNMSFDEGVDNVRLARRFHNKGVGMTREILDQYLSYVSPKHLFLEAAGQPRYYNVPQQGLLFVTFAPLFIFGVLPGAAVTLVPFLVYLFFVTPISSVLTVDFVPHAHRSVFMLVPLLLLATLGVSKISKKKGVYIILLLFISGELFYFWHQYSKHEDSYQSILRNGGDSEMVRYVIEYQGEYEKIIMPPFARIPIYYLYFTHNFDPGLIGRFKPKLELDRVDNVEFATDWCPTKFLDRSKISKDTLIVHGGDCGGVPGYRDIHWIDRRDSTHAYRLVVPE